jgi:hypothetical protein
VSGIIPSKNASIDRTGETAAAPITPSIGGLIFCFGFSDKKSRTDHAFSYVARPTGGGTDAASCTVDHSGTLEEDPGQVGDTMRPERQ